MAQASPERSRQGSPNGMEDNRSRQSLGPGGGNSGSGRNNHSQQESEEVCWIHLFILNCQFKVDSA